MYTVNPYQDIEFKNGDKNVWSENINDEGVVSWPENKPARKTYKVRVKYKKPGEVTYSVPIYMEVY